MDGVHEDHIHEDHMDMDVQVFMDERARHVVPMDGVHEDHMDMDVQVFMDKRVRLARGSHGWRTRGSHRHECTGFPWMSVRG